MDDIARATAFLIHSDEVILKNSSFCLQSARSVIGLANHVEVQISHEILVIEVSASVIGTIVVVVPNPSDVRAILDHPLVVGVRNGLVERLDTELVVHFRRKTFPEICVRQVAKPRPQVCLLIGNRLEDATLGTEETVAGAKC